MRGPDVREVALFKVRSLDGFVPGDHPPRAIREILNVARKDKDMEAAFEESLTLAFFVL